MSRTRRSSEADWVLRASPVEGVERFEAFFTGNAYASHRHDTYAISRSLAGVHDFQYRRGKRRSLPGHTIVLHPDEVHDGQAGAEGGFRYRMIYVEPTLLQDALAGREPPFIEQGISTDPRLLAATEILLQPMSVTLDPMEQAEALAELEAITGRDRWSLTRDFHTFYGTSPYRFLTMRRLDAARGQRHAISLHGKFERIETHWGPHVIAEMNDHQFRIVRLQGDFLWRTHVQSDETYFVFDGELRLDCRDRSLVLRTGEMVAVPKGIEHKPYAADEVKLLLIAQRSFDQFGEARWVK